METSTIQRHKTVAPADLGMLRFQSDKRQIGAILMLAGFCAIFQPLAGIAGAIGPNGTTANTGIPLSGFIGGLCLVAIGILSIFTGYNQVVHDWGHKYLTLFLIVLTQTAFIPYITDMTNIGRSARNRELGIPAVYNPTQSDFTFVGVMGILGVLSYGFTFVGSISFMQFSLYAYQTGEAKARNASYYRGRMGFYCGMLFVAGLAQLLLGAYIIHNFGGGELEMGAIAVAMFVVNFPAISVFVGSVQICNAIWGLARFLNLGGLGECKTSYAYQISIFIGWILQFALQVLTQVGYLPNGDGTDALALITALSFGLNLMPAYLDYKARTVPETIDADYYGDASRSLMSQMGDEMEVEEDTDEKDDTEDQV